MTKFKIKVTKDCYRQAMYCGTKKGSEAIEESCAVAIAMRGVFPDAKVSSTHIFIDDQNCILPQQAQSMIRLFDAIRRTPNRRLQLPEFEFEIEVPDSIINAIGIEEIKELLKTNQTLELI